MRLPLPRATQVTFNTDRPAARDLLRGVMGLMLPGGGFAADDQPAVDNPDRNAANDPARTSSGDPDRASPAEGYPAMHAMEQARIVGDAITVGGLGAPTG
jgi:hypothetical protein